MSSKKKLKPVTNGDGSPYGFRFDCPGCGEPHVIPTHGPNAWRFNGDEERPTFEPSLLIFEKKWPDGSIGIKRCHSFIRDGRIHFLSDCGHSLAGQTIDLPEGDQ